MDSSKVRVRFDGASVVATTFGKPLPPELQAANKSITIQRISNFYVAGPNGPANVSVSFLPGAVRIDGQNLDLPAVNFARVQRTYTYDPSFNAC